MLRTIILFSTCLGLLFAPCLKSGWIEGSPNSLFITSAAAQTVSKTQTQATGATEAARQRELKQKELEAVTTRIRETTERQAKLKAEIETLSRDMGAINRALVAAGERGQQLEQQVAKTEQQLTVALKEQEKVRTILRSKSALLSEVLAALQRMGRKPPPALLVTPRDALQSVRSAILLGAVVPEIRSETDVLFAEIRQLAKVSREVEQQQTKLTKRLNILAEDESRLTGLVEKKRELSTRSRKELKTEQNQAEALARNATSLTTLIEDLEKRISAAAEAAQAARLADNERLAREQERLASARARLKQNETETTSTTLLENADPKRKEPAIAFSKALGKLPFPVAGKQIRGFNEELPASLGAGRTKTIAITTRPNARVRAPADAWIVYAGPFRSFGRIIILNAGEGSHIVLSGLSQNNVEAGRFVLAGEPIGRMGTIRVASALSPNLGSNNPILTIEFRIKGKSVDPTPWWAPRASDSEAQNKGASFNETG